MPFANLETLLKLHPSATIVEVNHHDGSICFSERGKEWMMIFDGRTVLGVWDMSTPPEEH
jgi:hypothetical protein